MYQLFFLVAIGYFYIINYISQQNNITNYFVGIHRFEEKCLQFYFLYLLSELLLYPVLITI